MTSETKPIEQVGADLARGALPADDAARIAAIFAVVSRLLLRAEPVTVDEVAAASGLGEAEISETLDSLGAVERDGEGRVLGLGLTLVPTPHRFRVDGRNLYTWCALDTLIYPSLLGVRAEVESPCQSSGTPVRLTATPEGVSGVEPPSAVVSVVPIEHAPNIRTAFCDHVHFFRSAADADAWLGQHPGGMVMPVADAFLLGRGFADQMR